MKQKPDNKELTQLITTLKSRFENNLNRHEGISWDEVEKIFQQHPEKLNTLYLMETTGGEPDVVLLGNKPATYAYIDCCVETPLGRRSLCYDEQALAARKENKPSGSALGLATNMGAELINEHQYRTLQTYGNFDLKTSSWLATPEEVRNLGGALFGDLRFGRVFVYHNGVQSYYAARGFRALLWL